LKNAFFTKSEQKTNAEFDTEFGVIYCVKTASKKTRKLEISSLYMPTGYF